ncbi:MAG: NAD(P)-dependent oxidoreductase [Gemmatimonadetes bacterium]|jgi:nucleoside-diphosphate-sugar epimerase|nr:NAD(P)-dependent oxidoreductase [Gemmatimonadota bacterium]MBT6149529.1 NAD(P)-dependent oxidoreductase [Gemmatimonadota bacterium]MBT7863596.1 NAD(P)-dependent oxidoreductase [Gemmatimonadota bacterium]
MKILVTGSAGRIGRHVVRDLVAAGHEVIGADVVRGAEPGSRHLQVDLTDAGQVYASLAGVEAVAHMGAWANAGVVPDPRTYGDNVTGTFNVLQACAELGVRRVVSASSAQVYGFAGHAPEYLPVDEDHPLRPLNSYALSKTAGEAAAAYVTDRYGLPVLSFRIMGVRAPDELPDQIRHIRAAPEGDTGLLWTRTDARDAAMACRLALESDAPAGIYNITAANTVIDQPTRDLATRYLPAAVIRDELKGCASPLSCARARAAFGYEPIHDSKQALTGSVS